MFNAKLFLIVLVACVFLMPNVTAVSLGVAPGILNVGDVYPGTSKLVEFLLITTSTTDMSVFMSPIEPHFDFFSSKYIGHYIFIPEESSNEDVRSWIKFPENPIAVSPTNIIVYTFPNGEKVRANKRVRAILTIPKDADPGYHVGAINFAPKLKTSEGGGGLATVAVTRFLYIFYVKPLEGQEGPRREGKITDVEARRSADGRVRIDVLFRNTGTDTVLAKINDMKIYDDFGELKKVVESGYVRIRP
ncbi:MAG: hypothetical protein GXO64_04270, partial [Candidatus Micrarchaeota archaeon]|nr:hypothetical protein [Candidatus Micrarchaeota archaeon]